MSEAWGSILIEAPENILSEIDLESSDVSLESIESIYRCAGINTSLDTLDFTFEQSGFPHEGISLKNGFICIHTFGDEWMEMIKHLIEHGNNVQVYGSIFHEYGFQEYYAFNEQGKRFIGVHDAEGGDDEEQMQEIESEWLSYIPEKVKNAFPDIFSDNEDGEDE